MTGYKIITMPRGMIHWYEACSCRSSRLRMKRHTTLVVRLDHVCAARLEHLTAVRAELVHCWGDVLPA